MYRDVGTGPPPSFARNRSKPCSFKRSWVDNVPHQHLRNSGGPVLLWLAAKWLTSQVLKKSVITSPRTSLKLTSAAMKFKINVIQISMVSSPTVHSVRGQSGFYNLALTERNMYIKFDLKLSVDSLGLEIWLFSFKFYFGLIWWPPQPPRKKVLKSIK